MTCTAMCCVKGVGPNDVTLFISRRRKVRMRICLCRLFKVQLISFHLERAGPAGRSDRTVRAPEYGYPGAVSDHDQIGLAAI